jgi:hypothetical protein
VRVCARAISGSEDSEVEADTKLADADGGDDSTVDLDDTEAAKDDLDDSALDTHPKPLCSVWVTVRVCGCS